MKSKSDVFVAENNVNGHQQYRCLLCPSRPPMPLLNIISHEKGEKHRRSLYAARQNASSPRKTIAAESSAQQKLVPEVSNGQFVSFSGNNLRKIIKILRKFLEQSRLPGINGQVIVGIEYVIEIFVGLNFDPAFHCSLCEGKFDHQTVINHLTATVHRLKYLVCKKTREWRCFVKRWKSFK